MATKIVNPESIPATPEQVAMVAHTSDMSRDDLAHVLAIGRALVTGKLNPAEIYAAISADTVSQLALQAA